MKTWQGILFGLFSGLLAAALILIIDSRPHGDPVQILPTWTPSPIVVHIDGAVLKPGVYRLEPQSRITDLIEAAGGLLPSADISLVNLATKIKDGEKFIIPFKTISETNSSKNEKIELTQAPTPTPLLGILNINTASVEMLDQLPAIGPTKAQAIVDYRTQHGDFRNIQELLNVPGIGPGIFSQIEKLITTE